MNKDLKHILIIDESAEWRDYGHGRSFMSMGTIVYRSIHEGDSLEDAVTSMREYGAILIEEIPVPNSNIIQLVGFYLINDGVKH